MATKNKETDEVIWIKLDFAQSKKLLLGSISSKEWIGLISGFITCCAFLSIVLSIITDWFIVINIFVAIFLSLLIAIFWYRILRKINLKGLRYFWTDWLNKKVVKIFKVLTTFKPYDTGPFELDELNKEQ